MDPAGIELTRPPHWGNTASCQLSSTIASCHWNCKVYIWIFELRAAPPFIFDTRTDVPVKVSKFLRQKVFQPEGTRSPTFGFMPNAHTVRNPLICRTIIVLVQSQCLNHSLWNTLEVWATIIWCCMIMPLYTAHLCALAHMHAIRLKALEHSRSVR